jgi:cytochrome c2
LDILDRSARHNDFHSIREPEDFMPKRQMYRTLRYPLVLLTLSVTVGCSGGTPSTEGTAQRLPATSEELLLASALVALPPAGVTAADLPDSDSPGAQQVVQYCTACHALPSPASHSATDWPSVLRRMWLRIERLDPSFEVPAPNGGERMVMSEYLVENALRVSRANLPSGVGRNLFVARCGRCHELPDPSQHTPDDWAGVVRRMQGHMEPMLGEFMSQADSRQITAYLQTASR